MYYNDRFNQILDILKFRNNVSVHYLAKALHVSEPTIRRDLAFLEQEGMIRRTYGGAIINEMNTTEVPLSLREGENRHAKDIIARQAARFISNGSVIFLDASSTVSKLVKYLPKFSDLTVISNSPTNSLQLAKLKIRSYNTGGLLLENSVAYVGKLAESFVEKFNADILFFSCRGLSEDGILTDSSLEESDLRHAMMRHAKKKVFLCTDDKIGKRYMYNLCSVHDVDHIICNQPLPDFPAQAP